MLYHLLTMLTAISWTYCWYAFYLKLSFVEIGFRFPEVHKFCFRDVHLFNFLSYGFLYNFLALHHRQIIISGNSFSSGPLWCAAVVTWKNSFSWAMLHDARNKSHISYAYWRFFEGMRPGIQWIALKALGVHSARASTSADLVVVANIQVRSLKTEVEKGWRSQGTAFTVV